MGSKIEWVNGFSQNGVNYKGETWNPMTGCTKISDGCENCYAERLAKRFPETFNNFKPTFHPDRLEIPYRWKKHRLVFVDSVSDLFHPVFQNTEILSVLKVIKENPRHLFILLTKRPERLHIFRWKLKDISNIWVGVTIESYKYSKRSVFLNKLPESIKKFISFEPLLGDVSNVSLEGIDWVIAGAESGQKRRVMEIMWVELLQYRCANAGIPFFYKQNFENGKKVSCPELGGKKWCQFPKKEK